MQENDDMDEFIDFILNDEVKQKEKELGLEHPSVEYESKEREAANKILEEKEIRERLSYHACNRF